MTILGIDPGYGRIGIAVVQSSSPKDAVIFSTCLATNPRTPFYERLLHIGDSVRRVIEEHVVDALAVEKIFFNKNQKTAFRVAEARGVAIYQGLCAKIPVLEFTPLQVKIALTGYGRGTKTQVAHMVHALTALPACERHDDEYDAIAIGLTALSSRRLITEIINNNLSTVPGVAKSK